MRLPRWLLSYSFGEGKGGENCLLEGFLTSVCFWIVLFSPLGVEDESIATGAGEGGDVTSTERMDSEIANFLKVRCWVTYMCSFVIQAGNV